MSYYNINYLAKHSTSYINNALIKEGFSAFRLYIIEYCKKEDLIKKEQYYFDLLKPTYNICKAAGSSLGRLHRIESKEKISKSKLNTKLGEDNHFYGQTHTEEARLKMVKTKLNKTLSEKVKSKISATMTGRRLTEQQKVNLSRGPATFPLRGKSQRKIPCAALMKCSACWAASQVKNYLY
jgi:group I intron endonuclease